MAGSLEPVVAKLNRAAEHYRFIKEELNGGRDTLLHPVVCEPKPSGLEYRFRVEKVERLDPRWAVVVGDAYFNLRATLDYLVYQLHVRHYGRRAVPDDVAEATAFPIRESNLTSGGRPIAPTNKWSTIKHLSMRDRAAIERLQPYNRRNDGLNPLRKALSDIRLLNNADKHRELHVVMSLPYAVTDVYFPATYEFKRHPAFGIAVESNTYIDRWTFTTPPHAKDVKMDPGVLLAAGLFLQNERYEVLANIGGCILAVWSILERFANRFPPLLQTPDFSWIRRSARVT